MKASVKNNTRRRLPTSNIDTPMNTVYSPEMDVTDELNDEDTTVYQELIGILRWATEIGRVNIVHEVSLLSQYQANPKTRTFRTAPSYLRVPSETSEADVIHVT